MALRGVESLLGELEKAKESLKDVDKNIAKLTGRNPNEPVPRPGQRRSLGRGADRPVVEFGGQGKLFNVARRGLVSDNGPVKRRVSEGAFDRRGVVDDEPPIKRRISGGAFGRRGVVDDESPVKRRVGGGAFSRLGLRVTSRLGARHDANNADENETLKHTVQSSVVAGPVNTKSREEVAQSQSTDRESKGRNRRMFGLLMGTLQRFKDDQKVQTDKEVKRKAVEEKLELKAKAEQDNVKRERRKLFQERQRKEQKIKRLEQKMELVKIHDEWASQTQMLGNFIRTKAKPHLYYIPKTHVTATKDRLGRTKNFLEDIIKDRRKHLEEEIKELMLEEEEGEKQQEPHEEDPQDEEPHEEGLGEEGPCVDEDKTEGPEELEDSLVQEESMDQSVDQDQSIDQSMEQSLDQSILPDPSVQPDSPMDDGENKQDEAEVKVDGRVVEDSGEGPVEKPVMEEEGPVERPVEAKEGSIEGRVKLDKGDQDNMFVIDRKSQGGPGEHNGIEKTPKKSPEFMEKPKKHEKEASDSKSEKQRSSHHRSHLHREDDRERDRRGSSHRKSRSHRNSEGDRDEQPRRRSRSQRDSEGDRGDEDKEPSKQRSRSHRENKWDQRELGQTSSTANEGNKRKDSAKINEDMKDSVE